MELNGTQAVVVDTTGMTRRVELGFSSIELRLDPTPIEELGDRLLYCLPVLQKALAKTDEMDLLALVHELKTGRFTLLVEFLGGSPQGAAVTVNVDYPMYRACEVVLIAGFPNKRILYPNSDSLELLKIWARKCGCRKLQGFTDEGVGRLWKRIGFVPVKQLMRIDL